MKISAIETLRLEEFGNLLWVLVETDEGLVGLGETFFGPRHCPDGGRPPSAVRAPRLHRPDIFRGFLPFMCMQIVILALILLVPEITTVFL